MGQGGRAEPRISLNKLGEYMTAPAGRRRQIVKEQKYPPTFQVIRYTAAEDAIVKFMLKGCDGMVLDRAKANLAARPAKSSFDKQRIALCTKAIDAFQAVELDLSGARILAAPVDHEPLMFSGVAVSVRPNVLLVAEDRKGQVKSGLLKLHFSKTHRLDETSGDYVGAVLRKYAAERITGESKESPTMMRVVDVFGGLAYEAPVAMARRLRDVEAACEEIRIRWPTI
jgi:hypothetical protein